MTNDPTFWNNAARKYAASPVGNEAAYHRKLAMTQKLFSPDSVIAEFGCGTGTTALHHAPHVNHVWATDGSEKMIEIAWDKARQAGIENVLFEVADIDDYLPEPGRYDVVMMHSLLHLLKDRRSAIRKAGEMLKPGGYFVTNTVCLTGLWRFIWPVIGFMRLFGQAPLLKFFSGEALARDIEAAGFAIEEFWKPDNGVAVFIIAQKPASADT